MRYESAAGEEGDTSERANPNPIQPHQRLATDRSLTLMLWRTLHIRHRQECSRPWR
jgi:hypothetical protein